MDEILNKVSQSKLITFDLEDYYPKGERVVLDIKDWLYEGFILREKDFREVVASHDWNQYQDKFVALTCSTDAIIPGWAYMLLTTRLQPFAKKVVVGSLEDLETSLYQTIIENIDVSSLKDHPVIIKGCSKKPVPANAYLQATAKIQTVAKSIMYGEACSSVPLFKRK
ncbi:DUF2480 family protein [Cellulophaga sp. E16_2]|uniref:DUF2480 family protein n=1 Tax=Cellulophaga algicola (strain DSM 14237 / IC166 / ACAM 630) TaxID=688270 RepID=E6XBS6_CELAD|nr:MULTISPECIES: DUF2480 family protein [Cellulophaga]ADV48928.1 Protein of unknown function DUF2480 [Cellulophaga algicola DSM 14237]MBO0591399.1 DUF2480 family protein [Cellulophaga sp. E16_2]